MVTSITRHRLLWVALGCALALALVPSVASAHAQLESTSPARDATLKRAPADVEFRFGESVEAAFGSVRVFDQNARRVDIGEPTRPDGPSSIGIRLKPNLPDGSFTATYRVISADSHPVSGGFVFHVGRNSEAPSASVSDLATRGSAGPATQVGFGLARFAGYAALALALGGLAFAMFAFGPATKSPEARDEFDSRLRQIVSAAVVIGVVASVCDLVFQGATAAGESFWSALSPNVIDEVIGTRSGTWMFVRLCLWVALAVFWFASARRSRGVPLVIGLLAVAGLMPALAGHAAVTSPRLLMIACDWLHVLAMATWLGGLVAAVFVLPRATAVLEPKNRTGLLLEALSRFSPIALGCVAALLVTGIAQTVIHLTAISQLWSTPFGRAILIKSALLVALIGFGAFNRRVALPALHASLQSGVSPGAVGVRLKRSLVAEVALIVVVIGVASALVAYPPSSTASTGPYAVTTALGPAELQLTMDPARVGANAIHVDLTDPKTGALYTRTKQLRVSFSLPELQIGPLELTPRRAGPGHFVITDASVAAKGKWLLTLELRVTTFDQFERKLVIPIN